MGITYEELKKLKGNSIVLERQENIQIEQTSNNYIRKKHTIIREKFPREESTKRINEESKKKAAESKKSGEGYTKGKESKTITKALIKSLILEREEHQKFEQKLYVTTQHLNHLEKVIQHEIKDLKKEHSLLKKDMSLKTKNTKNSEDMSWAENLKANDIKATKEEVEVTVEKYSQQHQGVSISPRYTNNDDVAVRPKKRTIASQMETPKIADDRGAFGDYSSSNDLNLKQGYDKDITAKINDPVPNKSTPTDLIVNCCHGMHYGVHPNAVCQRYNMVHSCNGVVCNQRKYQEFGVTPQCEYNYSRDEYFYDYPNTTTINCNNTRKTNVGRHCTDLNTQYFYCQKKDKSTSPKTRSPSNSKRNDDLIKKYETTAKAKPSQEPKEKLEKDKKSKETCEEYALSIQGEYKEKKEKTKERTNSKKRNKSKDKKVKSNSMIFEEEHKNLLHKKPQYENPSTLEHLNRYTDVGTLFKNSKYMGNQRIDESSSTATTFKIKTKKKVCHKTFKKSSWLAQDTPNYSLDSAESKKESQYSLETLSMLKKIKIREYKALQPSHKMPEKLNRSFTNPKAKETLKEKTDKIKKYKEYINVYRKEVGEDSKEETKNLREQLKNCRNELQTLVNQLQIAKQQNLTNQTQLSLSETLENLPITYKDQPQINRKRAQTQVLEEKLPQTPIDQSQIYKNGPRILEDQQQHLNDQTQTSKDTKDQPKTKFSTPYTSKNLREQTQIPSYDPETSIDQFPTSSNKLPILKQQSYTLRDQLYILKLQPKGSIDQAQLLMQQTFRKSRAETKSLRKHLQSTNDKILNSRDHPGNHGNETQTSTNLPQTIRDQPIPSIGQTQIYKDQPLTSRDQRYAQDIEVSDSYVEERYEYGPAGWNDYDENIQRISDSYTAFGREKYQSGYGINFKDGYMNKENPARARDYDNRSKSSANQKEYQHEVEHYNYKSKFNSAEIEEPKNTDNRDYNWRIQRDQIEDKRYGSRERSREPRHDKDRNVDSSGQKEYNFKGDRYYHNGNRSKASASQKEYQNEVEQYEFRKNSGEIKRSLNTNNIDHNSRRQREYTTEDKRYYDTRAREPYHKEYKHVDSGGQTEYRPECHKDYYEAIEIRHKNEHGPRDRHNTDYSQATVNLPYGSRYRKNRGDDVTNEVYLYQYKSKSAEVAGPLNTCNRDYNSRRQREYQTEDERFYGTRARESRHEKQRNVNLERQRVYASEADRQSRNKYGSEYKDLNYSDYKQTTTVPRDGAKYHEERDYDEIRYRYEYPESYQDYDTTDTEFSTIKEVKYKVDKYFEPRSHSKDYKDYGRSEYNEWPRKCKDHEQQNVKLNKIKNYNGKNSQNTNKDKKYKLTPPQDSFDSSYNEFKEAMDLNLGFQTHVSSENKEIRTDSRTFTKTEDSPKEERRKEGDEVEHFKNSSSSLNSKAVFKQKQKLATKDTQKEDTSEIANLIEEITTDETFGRPQKTASTEEDLGILKQVTEEASSESFTKLQDSPKVEHSEKKLNLPTLKSASYNNNQQLEEKYTQKQDGSEITNLIEETTTDETFGRPQKTISTEDDLRFLKQEAEQASSETLTKSPDPPTVEQHSEKKLNLPTLKSASYNNNQKLEEKNIQKEGSSVVTQLKEEKSTETFGLNQKPSNTEEVLRYIMNLLASNEKLGFEEECLKNCSAITKDLINKLSSCTTTTNQIITFKTHSEEDTFSKDTHIERLPLKQKSKDSLAENATDELQYTRKLSTSNVNQQKVKQNIEEVKYLKDTLNISTEKPSLEDKSADTLDEKTLAETKISDQQTMLKSNPIEMEQYTKSIGETSVETYCTPINKETEYEEETSPDICNSIHSKKNSNANDRNLLEIDKTNSQNGSNSNSKKKKEIVPQTPINYHKLETLSNLEEKQALENILNTSNHEAALNDYYCYEPEQEFYYYQPQTEPEYLENKEDYKRHLEYQEKVLCIFPPDEYINPQQSPYTEVYPTSQDYKQSQYNPNRCYETEYLSPKAPCTTYENEFYSSPAPSETNYVPSPSPSRVSQKSGAIAKNNQTTSQFTKACDAVPLLPLKSILKPCCANKVTAEILYELETYRTTSSISLGQEERINMERASVGAYILGQEKISQHIDENIDTVIITKDECLRPLRKQTKRIYPKASVKQSIYKDFSEEQHTCTKTNSGSKYSESMDRYSAQNIPSFTNCACMMNTYLDMLEIFYKSKNKLNSNKNVFSR